MTALHWTCFHNRPQHVQLLLSRGADVTIQDVDGRSPLHWAAQVHILTKILLLFANSVKFLISVWKVKIKYIFHLILPHILQ